jgi:hypothetical protein
MTKLWDEQLPVGARCVALQRQETNQNNINPWIPPGLHPLELEYGLQLPSLKTRNSFFLGRLALRQVLDTEEPILKDAYGRPRLPDHYVASISHKGNVGVALIQPPMQHQGSIGVDLEYSQSQGSRNVARKVLTPREQDCLGQISVGTNDDWLQNELFSFCCSHVNLDGHTGRRSTITFQYEGKLVQGHASLFVSLCRISPSGGSTHGRWKRRSPTLVLQCDTIE